MTALASIEIESRVDAQIARVAGEIDISNARQLARQIEEAVPNTSFGAVIDLTETRYLDSAGINMLFELSDRLERRQQSVHVVIPPASRVGRLLEMVNLGSRMSMHGTVAQAVEAIGQAPGAADGPSAGD